MSPGVARHVKDEHRVEPGIEVRSLRNADDGMACRVEAEKEDLLAGTVDPGCLRPGGQIHLGDAVKQPATLWEIDPCRRCIRWRGIRSIDPPDPQVAAADENGRQFLGTVIKRAPAATDPPP